MGERTLLLLFLLLFLLLLLLLPLLLLCVIIIIIIIIIIIVVTRCLLTDFPYSVFALTRERVSSRMPSLRSPGTQSQHTSSCKPPRCIDLGSRTSA